MRKKKKITKIEPNFFGLRHKDMSVVVIYELLFQSNIMRAYSSLSLTVSHSSSQKHEKSGWERVCVGWGGVRGGG